MAGFLDSFDGVLARHFDQASYVGRYLDSILDQYAHIMIYGTIGFLYPSYIVFFFLEIALDIWMSTFTFYRDAFPQWQKSWPDQSTFLSSACTFSFWEHSSLRLFRWYGCDIFHTLLIIRYILIHEQYDRKLLIRIQRYIKINQILVVLRCMIIFTSISALLRTLIGSCFMIDNWYRMASMK